MFFRQPACLSSIHSGSGPASPTVQPVNEVQCKPGVLRSGLRVEPDLERPVDNLSGEHGSFPENSDPAFAVFQYGSLEVSFQIHRRGFITEPPGGVGLKRLPFIKPEDAGSPRRDGEGGAREGSHTVDLLVSLHPFNGR